MKPQRSRAECCVRLGPSPTTLHGALPASSPFIGRTRPRGPLTRYRSRRSTGRGLPLFHYQLKVERRGSLTWLCLLVIISLRYSKPAQQVER